ncbi:hypothetical protein H4Q26_005852 [Puccinia striiformis f. sp. tritici PST-130]|nr:hypothetical protein H4Q26_005852 [Puccinia striiformis f. sp. tritici PST-130]
MRKTDIQDEAWREIAVRKSINQSQISLLRDTYIHIERASYLTELTKLRIFKHPCLHLPHPSIRLRQSPTKNAALCHALITPLLLDPVPNNSETVTVIIDGYSLTIQDLIRATTRIPKYEISKDPKTSSKIASSLKFMLDRANQSTYGVTTGFGAAATTRTHEVGALQVSIIEHLLCGLTGVKNVTRLTIGENPSIPIHHNIMAESVVRTAILIRVNSLSRGHSAVRFELLESLVELLNRNITPIVPLRGTISASGDLTPLAYVAGAVCGHPDVYVIDRSNPTEPKIMNSQECMKKHNLAPLVLGPKEGLAIANGTAFSAGLGSIVIYETHILALLSQVLTAMTVETLVGQIGAFHPFIHKIARPHSGQIEVAENVYKFLKESKLVENEDQEEGDDDFEREKSNQILRQDRYPLRTAPQWIGPQLEDILTAHQTISVELNSTTDNPTSIATSMEKTRLSIAAIGKIMFAQLTELNNSNMNKGLPSCLNGSEPSINYHTKGLDTHCAAYCSELQFLASPVTTHVQSAEGHNQSINSLAFISARKTAESIEILKMLMASHLYCLCQALDLRVIEIRLKESLVGIFKETLQSSFGDLKISVDEVVDKFMNRRETSPSLDSSDRVKECIEVTIPLIVKQFESDAQSIPVGSVTQYMSTSTRLILNKLEELSTGTLPTSQYLGSSRVIYDFVRVELDVQFRVGDVASGVHTSIGSSADRILCCLSTPSFLNVLLSLF